MNLVRQTGVESMAMGFSIPSAENKSTRGGLVGRARLVTSRLRPGGHGLDGPRGGLAPRLAQARNPSCWSSCLAGP